MLRMDSKRIVGRTWRFPYSCSIVVWNRLTMEKECILQEPDAIIRYSFLSDLQIIKDLVICSYHKGNICIWDLNKKKIIKQFTSNRKSQYVRLHVCKHLLIGCYTFKKFRGELEYLSLFIICEINEDPSKICINRSEMLDDVTVSSIQSNSETFVLFLKTISGLKIQFRTLNNFQVMRELNMEWDPYDLYYTHGYGGFFFASNEEKTIKYYDRDTFSCLRVWTMTHKISSLFMYSHFLIVHTTQGELMVFNIYLNWDKKVLDCNNFCLPNENCNYQFHNDPFTFICDGLEFVAISHKCHNLNSYSSSLIVVNFFSNDE
jgi:WD40 repeat protein